MGRYATTAAGELKLSGCLAIAVGHVVGDRASRNHVKLSKAEVEQVILTMKHMVSHSLASPDDTVSIYTDASIDDGTRGWYHSHLQNAPDKMEALGAWLLGEEESLSFA